ncbi:aminotransferase class V-fold PLP-dependent enzyme [Pontibacter liquoris]|uniref:aminotransferase class V-fold PLP-dependent enzyme n=1 Tax=Pontibacter liquoris TaxID=2905677 RepID=UPI001FA70082|nr:aminotransferase class V-fold PLP-dependent enzyme [Pontibacter liquoris]
MNQKLYFTPGPSELYPTVPQHMHTALEQKIGSISHRSQQFKDIYARAVTGLRQLLQLPDNYEVLFLSSATEVWERAIQNTVQQRSFHLVNGSFSKRFREVAIELGRDALKYEVPFGQGFDVDSIQVPADTELLALIQNETSSGACMPVADINLFREKAPGTLLFVDAVSSLPHPALDYTKIDAAYFSVQKCFGLPAGLGVWLVNDRCVSKADIILSSGCSIGSYHQLPAMVQKSRENQTAETPNVLGIYLLAQVLEDMNQKGIEAIRKETDEKAALVYTYLDRNRTFSAAVVNPQHRSPTTIVANTTVPASEVNKQLAAFDLTVGSGYGNYKENQIRIANFPAHSPEQMQQLVNKLDELFG